MTRINKKTIQRVVAPIGKNRDKVSSFSPSCILIIMLTLSSLIEVDARRKFIYIDFSHIKFLRMFPKYQFLAYL